jgi:hypothetical protein
MGLAPLIGADGRKRPAKNRRNHKSEATHLKSRVGDTSKLPIFSRI